MATKTEVLELEARIDELEAKVDNLVNAKPGRKSKPILVSAHGVCGLDPDRDSKKCPDATIYRYQSGCRGVSCSVKNRDYYAEYRQRNKQPVETDPPPKKRSRTKSKKRS